MDKRNFYTETRLKKCEKSYNGHLHAIDLANTTPLKTIPHVPLNVRYSHMITLEEDTENQSCRWYKKEMNHAVTARIECLTQEFLRLLIARQPETRLGYNSSNQTYFILSQEIPHYSKLRFQKESTGRVLKGLGEIVIGAYFLHEVDLKNGNIGLNASNEVCKIDGDWAFAWKSAPHDYPIQTARIQAEEIQQLPYLKTYQCYNWFDLVREGQQSDRSIFFNADIVDNQVFTDEKYLTAFKILLIPDSYFTHWVDLFFSSGASQYTEFLINRRNELLAEMQRIPQFVNYMQTNKDHLIHESLSFIERMKSFVINGRWSVVADEYKEQFAADVIAQFEGLYGVFHLPVHHSLDSLSSAALTPVNSVLSFYMSPSSSVFDLSSMENSYQEEALIFDEESPALSLPAVIDCGTFANYMSSCCFGLFKVLKKTKNDSATNLSSSQLSR